MAVKTLSAAEKQELAQKRLKLLLEMGEQAHQLFRMGQIGNAEIAALSQQISGVDVEISSANNEGYFTKNLDACPNCGNAFQAGSVFCPECGFAVKDFLEGLTVQCKVCGAYADGQQRFCGVCGNKL